MGSPRQPCDIFLSHAGEQKRDQVDTLRALINAKMPGASVFLDQHSLELGSQAEKEMLNAVDEAAVGVIFLTWDYVTKAWPMRELKLFVKRYKEDNDSVSLLPVFDTLTYEECKGLRALYDSETNTKRTWGERKKPEGEVLDEWVAAIEVLLGFTGNKPETYDKFLGKMREAEETALQRLLKKHGRKYADSEAMRKRELKASKTLSELEGKFNATAVQDAMAYFEGKSAEIGLVDFCISFALKKRPEDAAKINVHRRILQTFWKEFQAAAKDGNLPAGVVNGTNRNWAGRGKKYRELVEPIDSANWYYNNFHLTDSGHYFDYCAPGCDGKGRPGRYVLLQKLEKKAFGTDTDSFEVARRLKELTAPNADENPAGPLGEE